VVGWIVVVVLEQGIGASLISHPADLTTHQSSNPLAHSINRNALIKPCSPLAIANGDADP